MGPFSFDTSLSWIRTREGAGVQWTPAVRAIKRKLDREEVERERSERGESLRAHQKRSGPKYGTRFCYALMLSAFAQVNASVEYVSGTPYKMKS